MPIDVTQVQPLIQRSLNLMETASCWCRKASKKAHIAGMQGEKRRLRYLYREASNIVDWTEHAIFDHLKIDICAQPGNVDVSSLMCPMSTMNGMIEKLWVIRDQAHDIANQLVIAKCRRYAKRLYCYVDKLDDILSELQRAQNEYERANYEYHHISRYQVSYYNVHDEYEEKEETQGYSDHNY